jgi:hypothetical protein
LKRNSFTNLAQYLSGSANYQSVTSPSSSLSPPPNPTQNGEQLIVDNKPPSNCSVVGVGSVAKRRKTTPKRYKNITNAAESSTNNFDEINSKIVVVGSPGSYLTHSTGHNLGHGQTTNFNVKGSSLAVHHYSGSTSSVTASPSSPPHSHSTEGGDHQSALEICEESDRESARSTESTEITLNKSPVSSEYNIRQSLSSLTVNPSIKQYLQQHNQQLQEVNKSTLSLNKNNSHPYQTSQDLDENRIIIQEDVDEDKDNIDGHKDIEMNDTVTQLVILGSDNNTPGKRIVKDSININTSNYGETLDLSKGGKVSQHRGGNDNSETTMRSSEGASLTLCSTSNHNSYQSTRLSSISTVKSGTLGPNTTVPSGSATVVPTTFNNMTIFPQSQTTTNGSTAIPISNISQDNSLSLQSSISHHIKF